MRFLVAMGLVGAFGALGSAAHAQWLDNFDSYTPAPLAAQSLWDEWSGSSGVDAMVSTAQPFTGANSVLIVANNDVVYDFANLSGGRPSKGVWTASIKTYIASGTTGIGWYILLNDYPVVPNWSVQTQFDATRGLVLDAAQARKIKYDQWVSLVVSIDLDNDRYDSWYGDLPLAVNHTWTGGTGTLQLAATDLYGDTGTQGSSGMWFDNVRLDKCAGGPLVLTTKPNPIGPNATLNFYSNSPLLALGDPGMLFLWSVNGAPFPLGLLPASYDVNAEWRFSATVPPGLSGLELGFRMFALPAGGKIMLSNEDLVVMK